MPNVPIPVALSLAGALSLVNLFLGARLSRLRVTKEVMVGDGGDTQIRDAMRAQANLVEYAPFVLLLVLAIELTAGPGPYLWAVAALFLLARVLHPIGMAGWKPGRMAGALLTYLILGGLALWAIALPLGELTRPHPDDTATEASNG